MTTLSDVQNEVKRQLIRDYGNKNTQDVRTCMILGLAEEAGEVAGLLKRVFRDLPKDRVRATNSEFIDEMGDVLWYLTACCIVQGTSLDDIWEHNIQKLKARYGE
jgi:NTP pyrophosphatase (non-canonical NTP hydrolase)